MSNADFQKQKLKEGKKKGVGHILFIDDEIILGLSMESIEPYCPE